MSGKSAAILTIKKIRNVGDVGCFRWFAARRVRRGELSPGTHCGSSPVRPVAHPIGEGAIHSGPDRGRPTHSVPIQSDCSLSLSVLLKLNPSANKWLAPAGQEAHRESGDSCPVTQWAVCPAGVGKGFRNCAYFPGAEAEASILAGMKFPFFSVSDR